MLPNFRISSRKLLTRRTFEVLSSATPEFARRALFFVANFSTKKLFSCSPRFFRHAFYEKIFEQFFRHLLFSKTSEASCSTVFSSVLIKFTLPFESERSRCGSIAERICAENKRFLLANSVGFNFRAAFLSKTANCHFQKVTYSDVISSLDYCSNNAVRLILGGGGG